MVDVHTIQAIMQIPPLFANGPPSFSVEDSYVHNCISPILQPIFAGEPLLRVEWANSYLNKDVKSRKKANQDKASEKNKEKELKPDSVANVKLMNS